MTARSIIQAMRKGELSVEEAQRKMREIFNPETSGYVPSQDNKDAMRAYINSMKAIQ